MPLHEIQVGESMCDNLYEDLPQEIRERYAKAEYFGAIYHEYPKEKTAVIQVRLNDGVIHRWQLFDDEWRKT